MQCNAVTNQQAKNKKKTEAGKESDVPAAEQRGKFNFS
jgi:hypothetical protein